VATRVILKTRTDTFGRYCGILRLSLTTEARQQKDAYL
jgi:hypothetical protein